MRNSPVSSDQGDLFGEIDQPVPRPSAPAPRRGKSHKSRASTPEAARDVLSDINERKLGVLDDTDRVVVFEEHDRVRASLDEDTALSLMSQGYAERCPTRDVVTCKWGIHNRPVSPLRLTTRGRSLLNRWSVLKPLQ